MKHIFLLLFIALPLSAATTDGFDKDQQLNAAYERFAAAPLGVRREALAEIMGRLKRSEHTGVQALLARIENARKELTIVPAPPPAYHDPKIYTPGLWPRHFADKESTEAKRVVGIYRPHESKKTYLERVRYDFGRNVALDSREDLPPEEVLWDLLYGYVPGSDVLAAWIEQKLDHDGSIDKLAWYFDHVYCDLSGAAYEAVTIYDTFASREHLDMPDVDVIAYALRILDDKSYESPLPPGEHRDRLYERIKEGYLRYYRHRTIIDAIAELYLNPEAALRLGHGPLRKRILFLLAYDQGDFDKIRARLEAANTRNGFVLMIDGLAREVGNWKKMGDDFKASVNQTRWTIALTAQEVLREKGFLKDR